MKSYRQYLPKVRQFGRDRRGISAIIFALSLLPIIALLGLGIDIGTAVSAVSRLDLAADAAVVASVTAAANDYGTNPSTYLTLGQTAGTQLFTAQAGLIPTVTTPVSAVTLTKSGSNVQGSVTWTATYTPRFGKMLGVTSWPLSGTSAASSPIGATYLDVEVLLDNSGSMLIGATASDIATLQSLTACSTSGAFYPSGSSGYTSPPSGQSYNAYQCSSGGETYDGTLTCPIPATSPYTFSVFTPSSSSEGPSCQGYLPKSGSRYPAAGAPCAFACHFDTSHSAGTGSDYFAVARSTIGQSNQITLRFDVVKQATQTLISAMQAANQTINNLGIGIFTFDNAITQIYPSSGQAGNNWTAASTAVGAAPTSANQPDTGIQPYGGGNVPDTDFPDVMTNLASTYLTASGNGATASTPMKVLFIVTDGVADYYVGGNTSDRVQAAIDPSYCQTFKNMGYTVYVVYTPYYPLMNAWYLDTMVNIAEGTSSTSTTYNLQACASSAADYIQASDGPSLQAALQTFLRQSLVAAHLTQ